jgi:hypothetical protein
MATVFTVITNSYDTLKEPFVSKGWEYVCFSDKPIKSDVWDVRITKKHDRDLKINAPFTGLTLYVDGSIQIIGDLNQFVSEIPTWFTLWKHPHRDNTYEEAEAVIKLKGMDPEKVYEQIKRYSLDGFPRDFPLAANGIMLRDLSDSKVKAICDRWWSEWSKGVRRDQLSLMYCFWCDGLMPDLFDDSVMNKYFIWGNHGIHV